MVLDWWTGDLYGENAGQQYTPPRSDVRYLKTGNLNINLR